MSILKTIDDIDWTPQSVFNHVYVHLIEQGKKSVYAFGCAYRGNGLGDLACAVGCLIPDSLYDTELEGGILPIMLSKMFDLHGSTDKREESERLIANMKGNYELLDSLQRIHDYFTVDEWPHRLSGLAAARGLEVPTID